MVQRLEAECIWMPGHSANTHSHTLSHTRHTHTHTHLDSRRCCPITTTTLPHPAKCRPTFSGSAAPLMEQAHRVSSVTPPRDTHSHTHTQSHTHSHTHTHTPKVQRPGLKQLFDIDLSNLRILAEQLDKGEDSNR